MTVSFFDDVKRYVDFGDRDTEALQAFLPLARPHFPGISSHFYARILEHPAANGAIRGGEAQVERLKQTLIMWMESGLAGPHDEAFLLRRARIGRVHVQIELPQQYMLTAMNVMRLDFKRVAEECYPEQPARLSAVSDAVDKLFDIELAIMLNTYQEDSLDRLSRRERLATIGQLAATIGHDLRNPLGVIESSLYLLRRRVDDDPKVQRHLDKIGAQVKTCNRIITDLLEMVRDRPPSRKRTELASLCEEACADLKLGEASLVTDFPPGFSFELDPGLVRQALSNLVLNAAQMVEGRPSTITVRAALEGETLQLCVEDEGPGFEPGSLATVFEPLVSTRVKGVGLGLALVRSVATRHGGRAWAENLEAGGARVSFTLAPTNDGARS